MGDRVTAEPDRLDTYSDETLAAIPRTRAAVEDHLDALRRYLAAPADLPASGDPSRAREALATLDALAAFDQQPARLARDLRELDRWLDGKRFWDAYDHPTSAYAVVTTGRNVSRYASSTSRLRRLERYHSLRAPDLRWTGMNRAARRSEARALNRLARRQLPTARAAQRSAEAAMRAGRGFGWTDGIRSRITTRIPAAGRILPAATRRLGMVGVVVGAGETVAAARDGDVPGALFKGAGAVGGALLLAGGPVTLGAGAVLVGASLAYEYRDEVAAGARWAGRKLSEGLSTVKGWFGG